jgi:uroporphyrinogen decarboxylase
MSKRDLVIKALNNQEVERVPVGFWYHFAKDEYVSAYDEPEVLETNLNGTQDFLEKFEPDFVKLMSDGYFIYPNRAITPHASIEELQTIKPIGADHKWFSDQVALVKEQRAKFSEDVFSIYNVFAPTTYLKWQLANGDKQLAEYIRENPFAIKQILDVIARDIALLAEKVIVEGGADGIYFSTQDIQDARISSEVNRAIVKGSDVYVLKVANQFSENNVLHICGYEGATNDLAIYQDYPVKAVNWAVTIEEVPLGLGKEIFQGKAVIGGFGNTTRDVLYKGTRHEIEQETQKILKESGTRGVILGADCTVPRDIDLTHLHWARAAAQFF